jgi:hypothetical protein
MSDVDHYVAVLNDYRANEKALVDMAHGVGDGNTNHTMWYIIYDASGAEVRIPCVGVEERDRGGWPTDGELAHALAVLQAAHRHLVEKYRSLGAKLGQGIEAPPAKTPRYKSRTYVMKLP